MQASFVLFPMSEAWRCAKMVGDICTMIRIPVTDNAAVAERLAEALRELGHRDEDILLALPSRQCLCATITETGTRRLNQTALQFKLEEQLPVAIEDLTVGFIRQDSKSIGIGVLTHQVSSLIQSLEQQGVSISTICPAALLAAQQLIDDAIDAAILQFEDQIDIVYFEKGQISSWANLPAQANAVARHLRFLKSGAQQPLKIVTAGIAASFRSQLESPGLVEWLGEANGDAFEITARSADQILRGRVSAPLDLQHGKLATQDPLRRIRTPLRAAAAAAILLSICLIGSLLWRAHRYNALADIAAQREIISFQQTFPKETPPPSITTRLQSEDKRLNGLSKAGTTLSPSATQSVLPLLCDTLSALPRDLRFRIVEMRFEPQRLYVEGQTLDPIGADRVATALRNKLSLKVDPPHTEQPAGEDVTFTISAENDQPNPAGDLR